MRDIEILNEIIPKLKPYLNDLEKHFNYENEKYIGLISRDHDDIGRVLKYHLILEHYIDLYLESKLGLSTIEDAGLRFYQKAALLPEADPKIRFVKKGILEVNKIRNRFGHQLNPEVKMIELPEATKALKIANKKVTYTDPIKVIEVFTTLSCTFLIVSPKPVQTLFDNLYKEINPKGK